MDRHAFIKDQLVSVFFYGTRNGSVEVLSNLLAYLHELTGDASFVDPEFGFYLRTICRLILYTRDKKGERDLSYRMLYVLYKYYPKEALSLLDVLSSGWMDIRRMADYVWSIEGQSNHPIIRHCIYAINTQLYLDHSANRKALNISDVARWIPRESSNGSEWLFHELAFDWACIHKPYYLYTDDSRAKRKYKMEYRKMVSTLSRKIREGRYNQSQSVWGLDQYVREAHRLLTSPESEDAAISELNARWDRMVSRVGSSGDVLPVLDISLSMSSEGEFALYTGIGAACLLSSTTTLERRILAVDQTPCWVIFPDEMTFFDSVAHLFRVIKLHGRTRAHILRSMDMLSFAFDAASMSSEDIRGVQLVLLSDMDWTHEICPESVVEAFTARHAGTSPHITYWNVGVSGVERELPCQYNQVGTTLVSGTSHWATKCICPQQYTTEENEQCEMLANTPFDAMCSVLSVFQINGC